MLLSKLRCLFLMAVTVFVLVSCATTSTQFPRIDEHRVEAQTAITHKDIIDAYFEHWARLNKIAWPILRDNAGLCEKTSETYLGAAIGSYQYIAASIKVLDEDQVRAAGYDEKVRVLSVAEGTPAANAGLQVGDLVISINGEIVTTKNIKKLWRKATKETQPLMVVKGEDGAQRELQFSLQARCEYPVRLSTSQIVNAYTNGKRLTVTQGMLRHFTDDRQIAFVVGHELGHATSGHVLKGIRNAFVSGAVVVTPVVGIVGFVLDTLLSIVGVDKPRMPGSAARKAVNAALIGTRDFEREADYLGLYFYARSGSSLEGIEESFSAMARINPKNTWGKTSHPITPERILSVQETRNEILQKQSAGKPLIPSGYQKPGI